MGEALQREAAEPAALPQRRRVRVALAALLDEALGILFVEPLDLAEAEAKGEGGVARLQRAVPVAVVDIDRQHRDPVLARVADDLRRGVEPHRLRVEQRAGGHLRADAFDPGRDIDEEREAGSVALREAIGAEPLDLAEAALGEIAVVVVGDHALDEFLAEQMDFAVALERRHRPAQPVGLLGREAGADDGDLHRLFLEKRHAEGFFQDLAQRVRGVFDRLLAAAAAQVGVHHVALDRPRPDDRDLDHQIVELCRLEARQHGHLGPTFDLEHAQRIGLR